MKQDIIARCFDNIKTTVSKHVKLEGRLLILLKRFWNMQEMAVICCRYKALLHIEKHKLHAIFDFIKNLCTV